MEVAIPSNPIDFDFNSSVYASAPSTPRLIGDCYFSAPTSPTRISEINHYHDDYDEEFDEIMMAETQRNSHATVPFAWEEKPGVPKSFSRLLDRDFAFDVSGELARDSSSVTADDLFHGGVIRLMEPSLITPSVIQERERGRDRGSVSSGNLSSSRSRRTRSLPPFRGFDQPPTVAVTATRPPPSTCTTLSTCGSGKGSKKWSFKDLFLFRSASDGRAMDRDPLKKYSAIFRKHDEDFRISSMRSDKSGSGHGSKRRGRVSAHELHYNVNRAVSNDMKKKTFLPYKQGILGRLAFNPTVHALSNGFGFSNKN